LDLRRTAASTPCSQSGSATGVSDERLTLMPASSSDRTGNCHSDRGMPIIWSITSENTHLRMGCVLTPTPSLTIRWMSAGVTRSLWMR
jgi:hypothetical protein